MRVSATELASLRIGCVKYLNAQPLIHGWPSSVRFDHPSALCRKLAAAELDVALVSSFEYLRNPVYTIVNDVAVAADGPVYSVFLAHAGELEEIEEIALDPASQTSVNLLRCLLAERQLHPKLTDAREDGKPSIDPRRAELMIGDQAIRFRRQHESLCRYSDLAAEWKSLTGLPFVFAIWLVRPETKDAQTIADLLRKRRDQNLSALEEVIAAQKEFSPEFCAFYFQDCLRFELAGAEKLGLLRFRSLCESHGILPENRAPLRLI